MIGCLVLFMVAEFAVGIVLYQQSVGLMVTGNLIINEQHELADLENTLSFIKDAETGQRGYLLTENDSYLLPYSTAIATIPTMLNNLRKQTEGEAAQRVLLNKVAKLVDGKIAELRQTITLNKTEGREAAIGLVNNNSGKIIMDEIRTAFATMEANANNELNRSRALLRSRTERYLCVFIGLAVLGLGLLCAFGCLLRLHAKALSAAKSLERELQQKLVERSHFLEQQAELLNLTSDAILTRELDGTIRFWNDGAQRMYGFTKEEAVGRVSHELLMTQFPMPKDDIAGEVMTVGHWEGELTHTTRDARLVTVASRWRLKPASKGHQPSILETNTDVTEWRRADKSISAAKERSLIELKRSNEELQQFAYVCSHDLQEPLRVMANFSQLLARRYKGKLDDNADLFIGFIVDGSKRMQVLINDLLIYSRIQSREQQLHEVDCSRVLESALANLKMAIDESGATVHCGQLPTIIGESSQLIQVFQNLIANALKFRAEASPNIDISAERISDAWQFRVSDNGLGLDMKFADRIFLVFQRLFPKDQYPGSGIGLAICKKVVQRHGGRIWVESEPNQGTTFYFTIPVMITQNKDKDKVGKCLAA